MCAGTVVAPPGPTSAAIVSVTSTSRSVALKLSFDFSALIKTLARMGMVLRRSTTRWTWPSDFNSAARSTVTFIVPSAHSRGSLEGLTKVARTGVFRKGAGTGGATYPTDLAAARGRTGGWRPERGRGCLACGRLLSLRSVVRSRRRHLLLQLAFQQIDFFRQRRVGVHEILDLSHRMQNRGVVASAEAAADLRQRAQRKRLGEIHRHLPWTHDVCRAPRGQKVGAAHVVLARDHPLDIFDFDALGVLRTDQVAHLALGHFQRDRLAGELAVSEKAVERAFEIAAVVGHGLGNELEHRHRNIEAGMMLLGRRSPAFEDFKPQFLAERPHFHHQAAGKPRAHALVQALEI